MHTRANSFGQEAGGGGREGEEEGGREGRTDGSPRSTVTEGLHVARGEGRGGEGRGRGSAVRRQQGEAGRS